MNKLINTYTDCVLFENKIKKLTVFCTLIFTQSAGGPISITDVSNLGSHAYQHRQASQQSNQNGKVNTSIKGIGERK